MSRSIVMLAALSLAPSCRKQQPPSTDAAPAAETATVPGPTPEAGSAGSKEPDAAANADAPRLSAGAIPAPAGATAESGFERFWAYEPPRYRAAGTPPSLPIAPDAIRDDPALGSGPLGYWGLDDDALELLAGNAFVVLAGGDKFSFDDLGTAYEAIARSYPVYVTADAVLHLYHLIFDGILITVETRDLVPALERLAGGLRSAAGNAPAAGGLAVEAARRNLAVLDVVRRLLDPAAEIDARVRAEVEAEIAAIERHAGFEVSPVFGYAEDYTQYVPRGHYTRSEALSRYFRAMMWLGRMTYLARASDDPEPRGIVERDLARLLAAQSALFAKWLQTVDVDGAPAIRAWDRIYRTTAFFSGFSDDLTPTEIAAAAERAFGAAWDAGSVAAPDAVDRLRAEIVAARGPRIFSGTGGPATASGPDQAGNPERLDAILAATAGMRLMGQRYTPDADLMGRLVFPTVGFLEDTGEPFTLVRSRAGDIRGFSRGLDLMAMLGAPRARAVLETLGDAAYDKYDDALADARGVFPPPGHPAWHSNLYWGWLDVLREVVAPTATATQAFQTTEAWSDRLMTTALASWTALRRDTILYVKQPYAGVGTGVPSPPPPPRGFVEPYPELFARLRALGAMTRAGLADMGLLGDDAEGGIGDVLQRFDGLLDRLQGIAVTEVENRQLSREDNDFLAGFANDCRFLLFLIARLGAANPGEGIPEVDVKTTYVADVMTNGEAVQVLEEASGKLDLMVAVVRVPGSGGLFVVAGPVLSYFEFRWPMSDRLTDEAWRGIANTASGPPAPAWTCSYRTPCPQSP